MSVGISFEELLAWNDQSANYWYEHLQINPALLEMPCDIGDTQTVQGFVRHIWRVELLWGQRLAGLPVITKEAAPRGPLDALFNLHREALEVFRNLLSAPDQSWDAIFAIESPKIAPALRAPTRRKVAAHMLLHSQRHYAQLATLARRAGFPASFGGDLLFSPVLR